MENDSKQYGQMDFNLPHDVVTLPSGGKYYTSKKKSVKVGYLTAADENTLLNMNPNKTIKESIVLPLLRNKLYESDIRPEDLLDGDIEALLIFLRNTAFGSSYDVTLTDPQTQKRFNVSLQLDELNIKKTENKPNEEGEFLESVYLDDNFEDDKLKSYLSDTFDFNYSKIRDEIKKVDLSLEITNPLEDYEFLKIKIKSDPYI